MIGCTSFSFFFGFSRRGLGGLGKGRGGVAIVEVYEDVQPFQVQLGWKYDATFM